MIAASTFMGKCEKAGMMKAMTTATRAAVKIAANAADTTARIEAA